MIFQITIADDSPELEELNFIIEEINREQPTKPITAGQYVQNIVSGYFQNRVLNIYKGHAGKQTVAELKSVFGKLKDVRGDK